MDTLELLMRMYVTVGEGIYSISGLCSATGLSRYFIKKMLSQLEGKKLVKRIGNQFVLTASGDGVARIIYRELPLEHWAQLYELELA